MFHVAVHSLDFDGCLCHDGYIKSRASTPAMEFHQYKTQDIINANPLLLDQIKTEQSALKIMYVGSNRQSIGIERMNAYMGNKGPGVALIKAISDHLGATFNPLLMADVYGQLEAGATFNKMLDGQRTNEQGITELPVLSTPSARLEKHIHDESKITLLYGQMQDIALQHPTARIGFNFYDDRSDILGQLYELYQKYPNSIPNNVTLVLHQYEGAERVSYNPIQGTGAINHDYCNTLRTIANYKDLTKQNQLLHHLLPSKWEEIMQTFPQTTTTTHITQASTAFYDTAVVAASMPTVDKRIQLFCEAFKAHVNYQDGTCPIDLSTANGQCILKLSTNMPDLINDYIKYFEANKITYNFVSTTEVSMATTISWDKFKHFIDVMGILAGESTDVLGNVERSLSIANEGVGEAKGIC